MGCKAKRWVSCVVALGLTILSPAAAVADPQPDGTPRSAPLVIYVQPLEPAPAQDVLDAIAMGLKAFYPVDVRVLPTAAMPQHAWFGPRARWDADLVLPWLAERLPAGGTKVLGVTTADIFTHDAKRGHWGVLGLGYLGGKANVISTFRARRGVPTKVVRARIAKVAVHEVGHNFGLAHCTSHRHCLMDDANGTVRSTDRERDLCPACRRRLSAQGVLVPDEPAAPWL